MIGIYKITNLINNKSYIGQSTDIITRWNNEKSRAFNPNSNSYDSILSRAIRKYGLQNFSFEVLEECDIQVLDEKEQYYIYYFQTLAPLGYNIATGGNANRAHAIKLSYDIVLSIIQDLQSSSLTQLDLATKYNVSKDTITDINLGYTWHNPLLLYPIRKNYNYYKCPICGGITSQDNHICRKCYNIQQRHVERPSKEQLLKEIAELGFSAVGRKYGVTDKAIVKWCKAYNLPTKKKEIVELYKNMAR